MKSFHQNRRGVTLIELTLVMFILIAIGGVTLGVVANLTNQASNSTNAAIIQSVNDLMLEENAINGVFPDNFDALMEVGPGTAILSTLLQGPPATLATQTLNAFQAANLAAAGVTQVHLQANATTGGPNFNPTFDSYDGSAPYNVIAQQVMVTLNPNTAQQELNATGAGPFVVMGVGSRCGLNFLEPPVLSLKGGANPGNTYALPMIVFDVSQTPAVYVGAVRNDSGNIEGLGTTLQDYYLQQ